MADPAVAPLTYEWRSWSDQDLSREAMLEVDELLGEGDELARSLEESPWGGRELGQILFAGLCRASDRALVVRTGAVFCTLDAGTMTYTFMSLFKADLREPLGLSRVTRIIDAVLASHQGSCEEKLCEALGSSVLKSGTHFLLLLRDAICKEGGHEQPRVFRFLRERFFQTDAAGTLVDAEGDPVPPLQRLYDVFHLLLLYSLDSEESRTLLRNFLRCFAPGSENEGPSPIDLSCVMRLVLSKRGEGWRRIIAKATYVVYECFGYGGPVRDPTVLALVLEEEGPSPMLAACAEALAGDLRLREKVFVAAIEGDTVRLSDRDKLINIFLGELIADATTPCTRACATCVEDPNHKMRDLLRGTEHLHEGLADPVGYPLGLPRKLSFPHLSRAARRFVLRWCRPEVKHRFEPGAVVPNPAVDPGESAEDIRALKRWSGAELGVFLRNELADPQRFAAWQVHLLGESVGTDVLDSCLADKFMELFVKAGFDPSQDVWDSLQEGFLFLISSGHFLAMGADGQCNDYLSDYKEAGIIWSDAFTEKVLRIASHGQHVGNRALLKLYAELAKTYNSAGGYLAAGDFKKLELRALYTTDSTFFDHYNALRQQKIECELIGRVFARGAHYIFSELPEGRNEPWDVGSERLSPYLSQAFRSPRWMQIWWRELRLEDNFEERFILPYLGKVSPKGGRSWHLEEPYTCRPEHVPNALVALTCAVAEAVEELDNMELEHEEKISGGTYLDIFLFNRIDATIKLNAEAQALWKKAREEETERRKAFDLLKALRGETPSSTSRLYGATDWSAQVAGRVGVGGTWDLETIRNELRDKTRRELTAKAQEYRAVYADFLEVVCGRMMSRRRSEAWSIVQESIFREALARCIAREKEKREAARAREEARRD